MMEGEASRPVITEALKFLDDFEAIKTRNRVFLSPKIALPRVPHYILFVIGGWNIAGPIIMLILTTPEQMDGLG
jgi:kelch-like protein 10